MEMKGFKSPNKPIKKITCLAVACRMSHVSKEVKEQGEVVETMPPLFKSCVMGEHHSYLTLPTVRSKCLHYLKPLDQVEKAYSTVPF
jgi:hypothetical protein